MSQDALTAFRAQACARACASVRDQRASARRAPPATPTQAPAATDHNQSGFWTMMLGSMGVVYGDIGTSPLYALRARSTT